MGRGGGWGSGSEEFEGPGLAFLEEWRSGSTGVCFNIRREFSTWAGSGERGRAV